MWNQNDAWWLNNYNAMNVIPSPLSYHSIRPLTHDRLNLDEWSSFFVDVSNDHGGKSFQGMSSTGRLGMAGFRIENDSSVSPTDNRSSPFWLDSGVSVWSNNASKWMRNTDLKNDGDVYAPLFRGLRDETSNTLRTKNCIHYTQKRANLWSREQWQVNTVRFNEENELVSNILTDEYVDYPFVAKLNDRNAFGPNKLPLGALSIDNLVNHMLSHKLAIAVQHCGFHVHLTEFPRLHEPRRATMVQVFLKLWYIFEPMFYSFFPDYRSGNDWCQSMHSLFTYEEILNRSEDIFEALTNDNTNHFLDGRVANKPTRYIAVNLGNYHGSGTIEIRIGHSHFDSVMIQAYIHILQTLLNLSCSMDINTANQLLIIANTNFKIIPWYCIHQTSAEYSSGPAGYGPIDNTTNNRGSPRRGFFFYVQDLHARTYVIRSCIELFVALTSCCDSIAEIYKHIRFYHVDTDTCWLNVRARGSNLLEIDIGAAITDGMRLTNTRDEEIKNRWNYWTPVRMYKDYIPGPNARNNLLHKCKTCSEDSSSNACSPDFNSGDSPTNNSGSAQTDAQRREQANVYTLYHNDSRVRTKAQSELINYKISPGYTGGGENDNKDRVHSANVSNERDWTAHKNSGINDSNESGWKSTTNMRKFRFNQECDNVCVQDSNENGLRAGYVDWLGNFTPDEKLTAVFASLLNQKVIDRDTLDMLVSSKCVDAFIWLKQGDEYHNISLTRELQSMKIDEPTIGQIRRVYRGVYERKRPINDRETGNDPSISRPFSERLLESQKSHLAIW